MRSNPEAPMMMYGIIVRSSPVFGLGCRGGSGSGDGEGGGDGGGEGGGEGGGGEILKRANAVLSGSISSEETGSLALPQALNTIKEHMNRQAKIIFRITNILKIIL